MIRLCEAYAERSCGLEARATQQVPANRCAEGRYLDACLYMVRRHHSSQDHHRRSLMGSATHGIYSSSELAEAGVFWCSDGICDAAVSTHGHFARLLDSGHLQHRVHSVDQSRRRANGWEFGQIISMATAVPFMASIIEFVFRLGVRDSLVKLTHDCGPRC